MKGLLVAGLFLARAASAASGDVRLIEAFRARAGLPPISAAEFSRLQHRPEALLELKLESAQAFLAGLNPHFDATITPQSRFQESPELLEIKRDVAAARRALAEAKIDWARESLLTDGRVDEDKLDAVFNGSKALAARARNLPGVSGKAVAEQILDGAPRHADQSLVQLSKASKNVRKGVYGGLVKDLRRSLAAAAPSKPVAEFEARLEAVRALVDKKAWGPAVMAARRLMENVSATPFREATRRALWLEASTLEDFIRERGSAGIYLRRGERTSAELYAHVSVNGLAYKGDPLSVEDVRVQCHGDCAVQQIYNHPKASAARSVIGYGDFLEAVTAVVDSNVKADGMGDVDTRFALRELGLKPVWRRASSEDELLEALDHHGALMTAIRWTRNRKSPLADRRGNHAVVVQGAYLEDGVWRFVLIDSNGKRPQVVSYGELLVLGANRFESVEAMEGKELPEHLRGLPDVEARVKAGARVLAEKWAPLARSRGWWPRLKAWLFS